MSHASNLAVVGPEIDLDLAGLAANRRAHERLAMSSLAWLNEVRLKYGPSVALIDLSAGGAQIETVSHRLVPGRDIVIELAGDERDLSVPARILRCGVSAIVPHVTYRGAVEFKHRLELPARAALAVDVGMSMAGDRQPATAPSPFAARNELRGWHRLVVRYRDGRMLKGFGRDFFPAKRQVHVWPVIDAPRQAGITVQLAHLKAVFFVHDFDGAPAHVQELAATSGPVGRRIVITFTDGEVLEATTLNYAAHAPGFFVSPIDTTTNNQRIFVVNDAVDRVRFP